MGGGVHKEIHTNYTLNQTQDYLDIDCKKEIGEQYITLKLKIEFSNVYTNDMLGFYRSSYHTKDGKKRFVTHF